MHIYRHQQVLSSSNPHVLWGSTNNLWNLLQISRPCFSSLTAQQKIWGVIPYDRKATRVKGHTLAHKTRYAQECHVLGMPPQAKALPSRQNFISSSWGTFLKKGSQTRSKDRSTKEVHQIPSRRNLYRRSWSMDNNMKNVQDFLRQGTTWCSGTKFCLILQAVIENRYRLWGQVFNCAGTAKTSGRTSTRLMGLDWRCTTEGHAHVGRRESTTWREIIRHSAPAFNTWAGKISIVSQTYHTLTTKHDLSIQRDNGPQHREKRWCTMTTSFPAAKRMRLLQHQHALFPTEDWMLYFHIRKELSRSRIHRNMV